ncbi:PREDICTED: clathrin coat assembly protein AP180 [Prunus mume]|uniref:Clathrin coat assembly protein AP180 n=1 Tax=Prunus mume TaxID=102107 RepID=A0ABM0NUJ9_PRUMU|nr:PREDICTED: clathrin coat assembly protein AP180 [Prunus mume]
MPSKLKKAIGAVKDQTSISLAKVSANTNSANLEVTVLKATSHDVVPIEDKYVQEILTLISSNKSYASSCAQAIARRIGKTRDWIVALKSLMLVLRIFQDGDPYFPIEVLHAMKRGAKILNLYNFRDDSNSCPWDFTAFVRTFALYLDERLDCFLTGKLQRRFTYQRDQEYNSGRRSRRSNDPVAVVRDMKPAMLLDRIHYWQKLLDRAMATTPTGAARTNRLVLISLYAIVQETYDLYRDISDGLALLLDSFFQLQYQSCVNAFHACVKASKQFEELSAFYGTCKSLGVGRTSEYPSVQKISEELLETLQEFLKDQASFPSRSPPTHLTAKGSKNKGLSLEQSEFPSSEQFETASEKGSAFGSACTSLEDLMSVCDQNGNVSPSWSVEQEFYNSEEQPEKLAEDGLARGRNENGSNQSLPESFDLVSFDGFPPQPQPQPQPQLDQIRQEELVGVDDQEGPKQGWELVLFESANNQTPLQTSSPTPPIDSSNLDSLFQNSSMPQHNYNPFLDDPIPCDSFAASSNPSATASNGFGNLGEDDLFLFPSTMMAVAPTFPEQNLKETTTFGANNSNESADVTTFPAQNSNNLTMALTFSAQSPKVSEMSPRLWPRRANGSTTMAPTFSAQSQREMTIAPAFCAQSQREMTIAPTFCVRSTNEVGERSPKENTILMPPPTFHARDTNGSAISPTFCAQNPRESRMPPNFNESAAPTFRAQNRNDTTMAPTFTAVAHDNESVVPTYGVHNRSDTAMAPTFGAHNRSDTAMAPTFQADEPNEFTAAPTFFARSSMKTRGAFPNVENNDPFATFFSKVTTPSEPTCNGLVNQESLLHQQRLWLEQQNKIIAKHMS